MFGQKMKELGRRLKEMNVSGVTRPSNLICPRCESQRFKTFVDIEKMIFQCPCGFKYEGENDE